MIAKTPPATLAPPAPASPPRAPQRSLSEQRFICRVLQLYRFCPFARCRRMRGCHGEPQRCLATHTAAVPHDAGIAAEAILDAARYNRVYEGEGGQWLKENYGPEVAVFNSFIAALEAPDVRRRGYALKARFRRTRKRKANRA